MEQKIVDKETLNRMELIRRNTPIVFSGVSQSYRQKVVYNLLNIARSGDMKQFLFTLLRLVNARSDKPEAKELVGALNFLYSYSSKFFEKWAYSVIMGIISAKDGEKGGGSHYE